MSPLKSCLHSLFANFYLGRNNLLLIFHEFGQECGRNLRIKEVNCLYKKSEAESMKLCWG